MTESTQTAGRLYGVGLGPGDPSLMTVRAVEVIAEADVIAYHSARHKRSIARSIAARHIRDDHVEEALVYPVTTEGTDHPGGYRGALEEFYAEASGRLAAHLDAGRTVAVLAEGDPLFYGSYMHMHKRLAGRYPTEVVPGVTSVSAASARLGTPLAEGEEVLTILPGTLPEEELTARMASADPAVVMKLGRTFTKTRQALESSGRLAEARYVERATMEGERTGRLADVDAGSVPYFSVAVLPSRAGAKTPGGERAQEREREGAHEREREPEGAQEREAAQEREGAPEQRPGEVVVVGTGPAGPLWLTPETRGALATADDLVGYTTYLDRVPVRPGQGRHSSGNRVESERAEFALELAAHGRRVAVVSGGDPGVFAMATAVLEAASQDRYTHVPVRVLPGVTAANAAAARAGAPLGHDYATISLSDRLKPWDVIAQRLHAAAAADLVLALYNPGSQSRTWQVGKARELLLQHRAPDTPVVVATDVGGPGETVRTVRLADLEPDEIGMRTILLVGSSQSRTVRRGNGQEVVWTPRRYSPGEAGR
ncbi:precorrin-2 C(20)-methyltransferase [Streptomyces sp. WMMB 322]|uniref:precorrin-2 C(20)-methyltransferase n=1 Tax=Streptomyces sp. WMMB 322 TaxID=1286821 RepID=UPI0006E189FF|nr:precorrin-2 C(20)-methyltransferase [Streptomyces sp. WMMB 322]SCK05114.1 precorrin-2 C20-methyltransferase / precorrin-3B C17-methyltransferase [Streptomyces sp. WMMB 322]